MVGYAGMVMVLNMVVQCLLLAGTNRLCRSPGHWLCMLLGGAAWGLYAGLCLLPRFLVITGSACRLLAFAIVGALAFGVSIEALRKVAVYILLNMAFEGIVTGFGTDSLWYCAVAICVLGILCAFGFHSGKGGGAYVPVELCYGGKQVRVTALRDTGNMLTDPVTGQQVLVVDPAVACRITGLTQQQLRTPLDAMVNAKLPGLRLIPYRTIEKRSAFLLALRMQVKLGNKSGAYLVAFAPEMFGREGSYQALAGGFA